ncbi:hypothetical protein CDD81_7205 [Ophiocordyceps australis]|uniref:Uncharacterized protein n=1 Tax=Ophiocordyceps australis TaxID=1399860 RepID=A0A2C5Y3W8_9HYPO|nr:hypothetical protein CDD81_7205 [Ophiocordyceps australis]
MGRMVTLVQLELSEASFSRAIVMALDPVGWSAFVLAFLGGVGPMLLMEFDPELSECAESLRLVDSFGAIGEPEIFGIPALVERLELPEISLLNWAEAENDGMSSL